MQFKKLLSEDDAVSPVIGVILMVAITVILAAVIASFVLGLGGDSDVQPNTALDFDYSPVDGELEITISSGDSLDPHEVYLRGEFAGEEDDGGGGLQDWDKPINVPLSEIDTADGVDGIDVDVDGVGGVDVQAGAGVDEEISSGQGIVFTTTDPDTTLSQTEFDVVWDTGDDSATLDSFSGPDA